MGRVDELRFEGSDPGLDLDVVVEVRRRTVPRVKVTPKRQPPANAVDHITFRKRLLAGDLPAGTYRVTNGSLNRYELVTIPARQPAWVRTPLGRLWHRVRYLEIMWTFAGSRRDVPSAAIATWCGQQTSASPSRGDLQPKLADEPGRPVCGRCDTATPDRRRYPDHPALNGGGA